MFIPLFVFIYMNVYINSLYIYVFILYIYSYICIFILLMNMYIHSDNLTRATMNFMQQFVENWHPNSVGFSALAH